MRRRTVAVVAMLSVLFLACGLVFAGGTKENTAPGAAATGGPIVLKVIAFDPAYTDVNKLLVARYHELQPNVQVNFVEYDQGQYFPILATQMQGGEPPDLYATFGRTTSNLAQLVAKGDALPLNGDFDAGKYPKWLLDFFTLDGKYYAIPGLSEDGIGVYYNTAVFAKYNLSPPTSQADFDAICATLMQANVTPIAMPGKSGFDSYIAFDYFIQAYAADWNAHFPFGGSKFSDPAFIAATKLFVAWMDKGYFGSDFKALDSDSAIIQLIQGKAAMYFNGEWIHNSMQGSPNISVFYLKRPDGKQAGVTSPRQVLGLTVYPKSKHRDAAVQFARWYAGTEAQQLIEDNNGGVISSAEAAQGIHTTDPILQAFSTRDHSDLDFASTIGFIVKPGVDSVAAGSDLTQKLLYKQISVEDLAKQSDDLVDYSLAH